MTWTKLFIAFASGIGMVGLAFFREYGLTLLESGFRLDFSRSGWALSGTNIPILFLGIFVLLVFVLFPICVSSFGSRLRDEWSRKTGLPADQNPLEFFEIKRRNGNG